MRDDNRMNDLEMQQYLFDLQGYLVIENALSPKAVATLNQLVDEPDIDFAFQLRFNQLTGFVSELAA